LLFSAIGQKYNYNCKNFLDLLFEDWQGGKLLDAESRSRDFFIAGRLGEAEMANCNSAQVFSLQGKVEKV